MDLADRIYEAAIIPEHWVETLEGIGSLSDSASSTLFVFSDSGPPRGVSTAMTRHQLDEFVRSDVWKDSPSVRWTLDTRPDRFLSVDDYLTEDQVASDQAWAPLAAMGFGRRIASVVQAPGGEQVALVLARMKSLGNYTPAEVAALDALRPHLARAGLIAARLGLDRARSMVSALEQLGLAAAVVDWAARVVASNALLEELPKVLIPTAFGGLAIHDRVANEGFRAVLARPVSSAKGGAASIPVGGNGEAPPMMVHLLPICGDARDIFTGGQCLMVAIKIQRKGPPQPELLNGLFDLTPAEARLVCELAIGGTLPEIAARIGLSVHTVRVQLRAVAAKTGTHRQTELLQLVSAL